MAKHAAKNPLRRRSRAELVVYLFTEGDTERDYLINLARTLNLSERVAFFNPRQIATPRVLLRKTIDWIADNSRELPAAADFWLVFDSDEKAEEIAAFMRDWDAFQKTLCGGRSASPLRRLRVSFMCPCIEAWALLHYLKPGDIPVSHTRCQTELAKLMPGYDHDRRNVRFSFDGSLSDPAKIRAAANAARLWAQTCGGDPDSCEVGYLRTVTKFAGIYRLVERMLDMAGC